NICRSPLAAALLQRALAQRGIDGLEVASAGTGAWDGAPVSEGAYLVGLERGLDLSAHRARLLTRELVDQADLILTMARHHRSRGARVQPARGALEPEVAINATPLGLKETDPLPLDPARTERLSAALDLVYCRGGTRWVRALRAAGIPAHDGREMLVQQGVAAFGRFFPGHAPPVEVMRAAVHALKYGALARIADDLADAVAGIALPGHDTAWLVPVPLGRHRLRERGYNQSERLARALARRWRRPVVDLLTRVRETATQT